MAEGNNKRRLIYEDLEEGKKYRMLTLAKHGETGEDMVVYQALYEPFQTYVRPMKAFQEEIDKKKIRFIKGVGQEEKTHSEEAKGENPDTQAEEAKGKGAGTQAEESTPGRKKDSGNKSKGPEEEIHPEFRRFLDAETNSERIEILRGMRNIVDNTMINSMAVMLDVEIKDGPIDERYEELLECALLKCRYEIERY